LILAATLFLARAGAVELDIPVFAGGYGLDFYTESARQFERLRPGVRIRIYGDPRIQDQISVRVIAGNLPDAASAGYVPWAELIRAGKVLDLRPYLAGPNWEGNGRWGDTFFPGALDVWRIGDRVGGIPVSYSCWTLFYNRALFREHGWTEPRTWDAFFALCDRIRTAGIAPLSVPGISWLYPDAFLRAAAYNLMGPSGWRALNDLAPGARMDPRYIRAAAVEQRVMERDTLRGWEGETNTGAELAFLQGRAAMTVSGSWLVNEMAGKIPEGFELGAMNFPVFPDGVADPSTIQVGADSFFVFDTGSPERERLTVDFLRFLTSRHEAAVFVHMMNSPAAVRGLPLASYPEEIRDTARMILGARDAFPMLPLMRQPPEIRQVIIEASQRLTTGQITPEAFGRRLEEAAADDRAHASDPGLVEDRHPIAGFGLLAALAAAAFWLGRSAFSRAKGPRGPADGYALARLRGPVAAGFVGPALALYAGLVLAPSLVAFGWAFFRWDGLGPMAWAGVFNFRSLLFESDTFWFALRNNLFLMAVPALLVVPLSLLFAALIHRGVWGSGVFRLVILFPNLLGGIAAALLWLSAYEPHGGLVNAGISVIGRAIHIPRLANVDGFPWLSPGHLYPALVPIYLWMACGFNLILYLAAMEGIDPELYEAASIDGASALRQFFGITLPLIREVIVISAVFLVIGGLNAFEMVWLLTAQDPAPSSHTLSTMLVTSMFKEYAIGRATALAVVLFALVFACSAALMRGRRAEPLES
jgi:raffinose/stachyose/melibiose transport system permease protein